MLLEKQIETIPSKIIDALEGISILESIAILEVIKYNLLNRTS